MLLVLGRVSNVPTVWSNCLAAWLLGGGGPWPRFACLCFGATALYIAGMFLNDAFDADFDRQFRPERPIPAGLIQARTVWTAGLGLLMLGWGMLWPLGGMPFGVGAALAVCIVLYDAIHKQTLLAPILMAACRLLLYILAGCSAQGGFNRILIASGLAVAIYICGISYLARGESVQGAAPPWAVGLLFAPSIVGLTVRDVRSSFLLASAIQVAWVIWCLRGAWARPKRHLSDGVAGLLAGIVLVDMLAAPSFALPVAFLALFCLALLLQRVAPAT